MWQQRYESSDAGSGVRLFFPEVRAAHRTLAKLELTNIRAQIFTGHGGLRKYLFRFKLSTVQTCTCDDASIESITHILVECPRYSAKRFECESRIGRSIEPQSLKELINDDSCRAHFLAFAESAMRQTAKANGAKNV
ncbi:hypothetical protein ABMA28_002446 [Loxostege sticticalis]|uniref:Reverse transcriptase n=1 Tax=Loxostege sticticalis TaxID=481309 RepID=A0ABD0T130_LOXSC